MHVYSSCPIVFLPVVIGQCTPNHLSHPTNVVIPNGQGMQAILPNYQFLCPGLVTDIKIQVLGPETSRFDLQIWRPVNNGSYIIHWSTRRLIVTQYFRDGDTLVYRDQFGIPVMPGDVLGFFIEQDRDPIRLPYSTISSSPLSNLHYVESDKPLCNMSLCESGSNVKNLSRVFVSAEFGMYSSACIIAVCYFYFCSSMVRQYCNTYPILRLHCLVTLAWHII